MDDLEVVKLKDGMEIYGPFSEYRVAYDGYRVPRITAQTRDSEVDLYLDNRFGITVPKDIADSVVWFVANAMAIAEGYTCFGENSQAAKPYQTQVAGLQVDDDVTAVIG